MHMLLQFENGRDDQAFITLEKFEAANDRRRAIIGTGDDSHRLCLSGLPDGRKQSAAFHMTEFNYTHNRESWSTT